MRRRRAAAEGARGAAAQRRRRRRRGEGGARERGGEGGLQERHLLLAHDLDRDGDGQRRGGERVVHVGLGSGLGFWDLGAEEEEEEEDACCLTASFPCARVESIISPP